VNATPLISVIIPVYNCEKYLAEAITSVLSQTYQNTEVLIVDDGSTDNSQNVGKRFARQGQVKYLYQANQGIGAARNRALSVAKGEFFALLDADDVWLEDKLTWQMKEFERNPELDMIFGFVQQFFSPELHRQTDKEIEKPMAGYFPGTLVIKKESFLKVGHFATDWTVGEFVEWFLRAQEVGLKSLLLRQVVMKRRIHTTNIGKREAGSRGDYVRILKQALDRRRAVEAQSQGVG